MNIKHGLLLDFFKSESIEFAAVLPFDALRIINASGLSRLDFTPRSVVIMLFPYYDGDDKCRNISLYAVPRDYHLYFRQLSARLQDCLGNSGISARGFSDSSPIDERDAAVKAGLGIIGDNHLLINEKYGSYIFIGSFLFDADASALAGAPPAARNEGCLHCGLCTAACPSPSGCLSAVTQKKGELTSEECKLIVSHRLVWGCDDCQLCCPMNAGVPHTPIEFFKKDKLYRLDRELLCGMSAEEFKSRAFSWRGRAVLERNLELFEREE